MRLPVSAFHIGGIIPIQKVIENFKHELIKDEKAFGLFKVSPQSWIYIKNYGSVVFVNCSVEQQETTLKGFIDTSFELEKLPQEDYWIDVKEGVEFKVGFSNIRVPRIDDDIIHVIALNIAQSVALEDFQMQVTSLLELTRSFSNDLDQKGTLAINRKEVRRLVGKTMVLKNKIAENLFVFDTPDIAWSEQHLSTLDKQLKQELEIFKRHQGLQLNLEVVKENLDLFKDILQHRHSSTLEWIIIILIAIEIIHIFIP